MWRWRETAAKISKARRNGRRIMAAEVAAGDEMAYGVTENQRHQRALQLWRIGVTAGSINAAAGIIGGSGGWRSESGMAAAHAAAAAASA
jgi:hypothetical protein